MQKFQYRCEKCGAMFELAEPLEEIDAARLECPRCGSEKIQHVPIRWTPVMKRVLKAAYLIWLAFAGARSKHSGNSNA
jgi:putative FmdB family regulatory protein